MDNKRNLKQYTGLICEVKDYRSNKLLMFGTITLEVDAQIQITVSEPPVPVLPCGEKVKVLIFDNTGGFQALVGRVIDSTTQGVTLDEVTSIVEYEERRFYRVNIDIPSKIYLKREDKLAAYPIRIKDISLKGMLFSGDVVLSGEDQIWVDTTFFCPSADYIKATVVRAQRMRSKELAYGVDFEKLEEWVEQKLNAFLFEKQREEIRRKRGRL